MGSIHLCDTVEQEYFCERHRQTYLLTKDKMQVENLFLVACYFCRNPSKNPKKCKNCNTIFCQFCITDHLNTENEYCPNCFEKDPKLVAINLDFRSILKKSKFTIKCKSCDLETTGNLMQFESCQRSMA